MKKHADSWIHEIQTKISEIYPTPIAQHNAWILLEKLTNKTQAHLIARDEIELSGEQQQTLDNWLEKLTKQHMPLQYLLGDVPFINLKLLVEPPVLIPRPETEEWCDTLITELKKTNKTILTILDLCTGSGCIGLALAKAFPQSTIYATDTEDHALSLARKNAVLNAIENIIFIKSDIYQNIPKDIPFDLIVANPPYIAPEEWQTLEPEVKDWEDKHALVAENQGLDIIQKIVTDAPRFLKPGLTVPQLWIEIGYQQGDQVSALFKNAGFVEVEVLQDWYSHDRVVIGKLKS